MALKLYTCATCGATLKTFKAQPQHCGLEMHNTLVAPEAKMTEARDLERGRHVLKGQDKILKNRAKDYIRDVEMHDMIQSNTPEISRQMGWLNDKGQKRSKIDEM